MKVSKTEKAGLGLLLLGVVLIFIGVYESVPVFYVGVGLGLLGTILWNPFDLIP